MFLKAHFSNQPLFIVLFHLEGVRKINSDISS